MPGDSHTATAAIASSVLQDLGLNIEKDSSLMIGKNKIRWEKQKAWETVQVLCNHQVTAAKWTYFDGRKDNTIVQEKIGAKLCRTLQEEQTALIQEPGGQYVTVQTYGVCKLNLVNFISPKYIWWTDYSVCLLYTSRCV